MPQHPLDVSLRLLREAQASASGQLQEGMAPNCRRALESHVAHLQSQINNLLDWKSEFFRKFGVVTEGCGDA